MLFLLHGMLHMRPELNPVIHHRQSKENDNASLFDSERKNARIYLNVGNSSKFTEMFI